MNELRKVISIYKICKYTKEGRESRESKILLIGTSYPANLIAYLNHVLLKTLVANLATDDYSFLFFFCSFIPRVSINSYKLYIVDQNYSVIS